MRPLSFRNVRRDVASFVSLISNASSIHYSIFKVIRKPCANRLLGTDLTLSCRFAIVDRGSHKATIRRWRDQRGGRNRQTMETTETTGREAKRTDALARTNRVRFASWSSMPLHGQIRV